METGFSEDVFLDIKIRPAEPTDLEKIYVVEKLSFKYPYSRRLLSYLILHASVFLVAEFRGEIIGYVCGAIEKRDCIYGHIYSIAVHPNHRRKGVGKALMMRAIEIFKTHGARKIILECRVSNMAAIRFYRKLGFRMAGIIRRYYRDGEDALVMELTINENSGRKMVA